MAFRILVTGSREWPDDGSVDDAICDVISEENTFRPDPDRTFVVVHGDAPRGADAYAKAAVLRLQEGGWPVGEEPHPAKWWIGRGAGFLRNMEMCDLGADICLAFIKDNSRGATHCANFAEKSGINVRRFTR